jgi:hypothetical protein
MVGLSAFAAEQWRAATQGHPALKAIFPLDAGGCYGGLEGFRDQHPGGVIQTMPYHIGLFNSLRTHISTPPELPPPVEEAWQAAMKNPDYMMYVNLTTSSPSGAAGPGMFYPLFPSSALGPSGRPRSCSERSDPLRDRGVRGAYTYKMHWQGAQHFFCGIDVPHKHLFVTSGSRRAALPRMARRDHPLVRPLAERHRQWLSRTTRGQVWMMGRTMARLLRSLAGPGDGVDQVLPP